jgi:FkbH-like protein
MGILLAVCSKNNYEDAMEAIRGHKHMVLKEEDFVCFKINWEPKAKNIAEIAAELNIGIDSLVFVDDNPVERDSVRENFPEVAVPEFPKDTSNLEAFAHEIYREFFYTLDNTVEDKQKTKMYKDNVLRSNERSGSANLESFFKGLKMKITIRQVNSDDEKRATELTQKTNQFNLTTKRYTERQIHALMISKDYLMYIASVSDKYGDNGKVVLVIVKVEGTVALIDSFIMSCRVMGRFIEDQIIGFIEDDLKFRGVEIVKASFTATKKNKPVVGFYDRLRYELIKDENEQKDYMLKISEKSERKRYGELITE